MPWVATRCIFSKNPIVLWIKIGKTHFSMFSFYFWPGPFYISKAVSSGLLISFEKFTHYQIAALQRQWLLGRARQRASWSLVPHWKISRLNISKMRVIYCCRFIRSLIGSRTSVKLKVSGAQLQSSCRRVNFDLRVLDSKRIIHRVFDHHCLDIKHIKQSVQNRGSEKMSCDW